MGMNMITLAQNIKGQSMESFPSDQIIIKQIEAGPHQV